MTDETMPTYVFSIWDTGHDWHEEIKDAVEGEHALYSMNIDDENRALVFRGEIRAFTHEDFIDADAIIESMQERAYDESEDINDSYLDDISKEKLDELKKILAEWFDANVPKPQFYAVEDIIEVEVQLDADGNYVSHRVVDTPAEA